MKDSTVARYYVVIPAHNEALFIFNTIDSLVGQTLPPQKIVVVNDNSTDGTEAITKLYTEKYSTISLINNDSSETHLPGAKVVRAFYKGFQQLDENYDFIVKLDADLVLPKTYFETLFNNVKDTRVGITGGIIVEQDALGNWNVNHPMEKWHVRGAIKTYTKACFAAIGGLRDSIGWDTVDELLAIYNGFEVKTYEDLKVKHLRPVASSYNKKAKTMQGEAMYRMRYDLVLTCIATLKMAYKQKSLAVFFHTIGGYLQARVQRLPFIVTSKEGVFIRKFRYKNIRQKIGSKVFISFML